MAAFIERRPPSASLGDFEALAQRVKCEFIEMPGLSVTPAQAARLFQVERSICDALFHALVTAGFLRCSRTGGYQRAIGER